MQNLFQKKLKLVYTKKEIINKGFHHEGIHKSF